jgi:hypothetical protein
VGRIRLNSQGSTADIQAGAVISPTDAPDQCTGLCSQGGITLQ